MSERETRSLSEESLIRDRVGGEESLGIGVRQADGSIFYHLENGNAARPRVSAWEVEDGAERAAVSEDCS